MMKVVVRHLPATLSQETFEETLAKYSDINYMHFVGGSKTGKKNVPSFAFLGFNEHDQAQGFVESFSGHCFADATGHEYKSQVIYAPHQALPTKPVQPLEESIENDPHYLRFLEDLEKDHPSKPSAEVQYAQRLEEERELREQNGGELPQDIPPIIQAVIAKRKRRARKQAHSKKGNQPRRRKGKGRRRKPNGGFPGKPVKIKKKSPA
eukprot:TRINITY_DN1855_c0_g1_i4.p2 TRINITY_DN1855_c0_g1~~TRINITY_DN1855_c0_g1_i4.p2  ORF type:complete len:208 (-),score=45.66 TRINITY_DN1855_c0_g1_i4:245-868(-)